jgi:hypothetical protein
MFNLNTSWSLSSLIKTIAQREGKDGRGDSERDIGMCVGCHQGIFHGIYNYGVIYFICY